MENTTNTRSVSSTSSTQNIELLNEVSTLMEDLCVDMKFAAKWTKYSREYLRNIFKCLIPLTADVKTALFTFREQLRQMMATMKQKAA